MTSKPQNGSSTRRCLLFVVRALVLLPVLALRDSAARPTWPAPVELENTAARLAHPAEFLPEENEVPAANFSAAIFFQPTLPALPTKKAWPGFSQPAVATTATAPVPATASHAALSRPPAPTFAPALPASPSPGAPQRPRTLAAVRGTTLPATAPRGNLAQLSDQWNHSPQLRDRYLASLLREPPPAPTAPASAIAGSPRVARPDANSALAAQLSFNPFNVVSAQFRALATPANSTASFRTPETARPEYSFLGCRLPHSQTELRLGLMDLTDKQFRLNPGNVRSEESRERTAAVSARFRF